MEFRLIYKDVINIFNFCNAFDKSDQPILPGRLLSVVSQNFGVIRLKYDAYVKGQLSIGEKYAQLDEKGKAKFEIIPNGSKIPFLTKDTDELQKYYAEIEALKISDAGIGEFIQINQDIIDRIQMKQVKGMRFGFYPFMVEMPIKEAQKKKKVKAEIES